MKEVILGLSGGASGWSTLFATSDHPNGSQGGLRNYREVKTQMLLPVGNLPSALNPRCLMLQSLIRTISIMVSHGFLRTPIITKSPEAPRNCTRHPSLCDTNGRDGSGEGVLYPSKTAFALKEWYSVPPHFLGMGVSPEWYLGDL